jgi:perosamine synthetase
MKKNYVINNKSKIPVSTPALIKKDLNYLSKSLNEGWVSSSGPYINRFERDFANFVSKKYCILVSNCTAALEISIKSLNLPKNSEVIIPNFTIISNALSVFKNDLKIVPVDCDLMTWNMNIDEVEKKITKKTKAIIGTHIYNYPMEIDRLKKICKSKNIYLIEDAAEVLGLKYKNKQCGYFGDISVFSFYANKQITMGEGGIICTNNKKIYEKCLSYRNLCFGKKDRFNHSDIGWNYRLTSMQAALGISQLNRIDRIVKKKIEIGKRYYSKLKDNKNFYIPKPIYNNKKNIYWIVGILLKSNNKKITAKILGNYLKLRGIETRPFFWPINKQEIFKKLQLPFTKKKFLNSEYMSKYGLYLPAALNIKNNEIDYVCKILNNYKFK